MFERVIHRTPKDMPATCSQLRRQYIPSVFLNFVVYKFFKPGTAKQQRKNGNGMVEPRLICDVRWQSRLSTAGDPGHAELMAPSKRQRIIEGRMNEEECPQLLPLLIRGSSYIKLP